MKKNGLDYSGIVIIAYAGEDESDERDHLTFIDAIGEREWNKEREEN